jgi:putative membrane protein
MKVRPTMMWGYGYSGPGMAAWMIISSLIWLAIVGVAVWAFVRWVTTHTQASPPTGLTGPSAYEILRQRYARGEIDEPTFERMRAQLTAASPDQAGPVART